MFFSEEKNQKTYMSCADCSIGDLAGIVKPAQGIKSFLLLFFKKEDLLRGTRDRVSIKGAAIMP